MLKKNEEKAWSEPEVMHSECNKIVGDTEPCVTIKTPLDLAKSHHQEIFSRMKNQTFVNLKQIFQDNGAIPQTIHIVMI